MSSPFNTMSITIDKYIIITFSIVNNPYPCHPYMFSIKSYSSKFTIMSFLAPALKSPSQIDIPKTYLDTPLRVLQQQLSIPKVALAPIKKPQFQIEVYHEKTSK